MLREASEKRKKIVSILGFFSIPISGFVTDIYLPSFPSMAKSLMVPESSIQLTLTCFLLSYGLSQLFIGSILDAIGRYYPKIVALFVVLITSLVIASTDSILLICLLRVIQGISVAVIVIATRALFIDIHTPEKAKHYLGYFTIVWSCGPILAPFLGGYLEKLFNWHANFYFLAIYAALILIFELILSGESITEKTKLNFKNVIDTYRMMLKNQLFIVGIMIQAVAYSIVMIFNIIGPFLIENTYHFNSVVIGYSTLILGFSWMIGGFVGKKRMHLDFNESIVLTIIIQLILISLLIITGFFVQNLFVLLFFAFFIHICSGILFTSFFTSNMMAFPKNAGVAGGLMGGMTYIITSLTSFIISNTGKVDSQNGLAIRYFIFSFLLSLIIYLMYRMKKSARKKTIIV
ncbi:MULTISPECIES: MFS transporter [Empedobacter]|uniref:Multidrug effflux MFS transporter n=1 Tax=Empedobacter falsenii TaxID=343874 RepID=A0A7H9DSD2_9FLAO|nr:MULTISPECIES: MFS transporter [Empedobacter]QLL58112.1 multidrug effflux MFS transporter [Empedobacter falsenii]